MDTAQLDDRATSAGVFRFARPRRKRGRLDLDCEADAVASYGGREAIVEAAPL